MKEKIHYFDEIKTNEEFINKILESNRFKFKYFSYKNNNDTFNILLSSFLSFKKFILSIYNCFISYISSMHKIINRIEFIILLLLILFSFVITYEENAEIPTNLIISAYFKKNYLTRISYDMVKEKPEIDEYEDNVNLDDINFDDFNKIMKEKINKNNSDGECNGNVINFNNKDYDCGNIEKNIRITIKDEIINDIKIKMEANLKVKNEYAGKIINNKNSDSYLYNSTVQLFSINALSVAFLYLFIKFTLYSKTRGSFLFNLFFIFIIFNLLYVFYKREFYFASNCFFILFIYINKNLIDSVYLKLKYKRKDFEIFSTSLIAFDFKQFHLKIILLLNATILSGTFSIFLFKSLINYIVFYMCLFTLIVFLSNTIEPVMPYYLKPVKNIAIFFVGIINFLFSKIILKYFIGIGTNIIKNKYENYYQKYMKYYDNNKNDSLYFISDLFSLFCFDYIKGYLEFQFDINLLIDSFLDENEELSKNRLTKLLLNQFGVWIIILWICMLIGIIGIFKKEYMCLIMSVYLIKILMNYFCNIYEIKLSQFLFYLHSFLFLLIFLEISSKENPYLVNLIYSYTNIDKEILSFIIKIITLFFIIYYIIVINSILYFSKTDGIKFEKEIKKIKKDNENNNKYHIEIEKVPVGNFKIFCICLNIVFDCFCNYFIICLLIKMYLDYEKNILFKILYGLLGLTLHFMKTSIINKIKNKFEYYLYTFIWFLFTLRLINLTNYNTTIIFFINHLNLLIIIIFYFLNDKQNNYFTFFIIFVLVIGYYKLKSYMIIVDIIFIFMILLVFNFINLNSNDNNESDDNKNDDEKDKNEDFGSMNVYNSLSLLFLLPILVFFLIQLKFQNYFNFLNNLDQIIKDVMIKMYILDDDSDDDDQYNYEENEPIEFFIISEIIYAMKIVSGNY